MAEIHRRLRPPAAWRIVAGVALVAAGLVASGQVHRHHGVPLFLAVIGCGAVLGWWALRVLLVLAFGFVVEQAITGGFSNLRANGSGDNLGAESGLAVVAFTTVGAIGILLGIALRAVVGLIARLPSRRRGGHGGTAAGSGRGPV
jgi:hypothetical protein